MEKYIYNISCSFYEHNTPLIYENVLVMFTEYKDNHIEAILLEYENYYGMMIYCDATRKKKIYDWHKEIPLNKPTIARVEKILTTNYVQLSTLFNINKKKNYEESLNLLMKPFNDNKILVNISKNLCKNCNIDFNIFWCSVIYKIDAIRKDIDINKSLLEVFQDNLNIIDEFYDDNNILIQLKKLLINKKDKLLSKFRLISKYSINNTINLLQYIENNNKWEFTIKYNSESIYFLESSCETSTLQDHTNLINMIMENANNYDCIFENII